MPQKKEKSGKTRNKEPDANVNLRKSQTQDLLAVRHEDWRNPDSRSTPSEKREKEKKEKGARMHAEKTKSVSTIVGVRKIQRGKSWKKNENRHRTRTQRISPQGENWKSEGRRTKGNSAWGKE